MDTLFLVSLIVSAVFGIGFLFIPGPMLGPFGVTLNATATTFARLFGSTLISFAILLWFARQSKVIMLKKGLVYSLFTYYLVSSILLVITQLSGLMNALGWSIVGLHVILMVWFGVFLFKK
ncbi:MAG: hypothetical protein ABSF99_04300 [Anaerolineales bacterium]|jgi:hypothetical protein